jgi:hypothetical protein
MSFVLKKVEGSPFLASMGDFFLTPAQVILSGKRWRRLKGEFCSEAMSASDKSWVRTFIALALFIPSLLLGSFCKGIAYLSQPSYRQLLQQVRRKENLQGNRVLLPAQQVVNKPQQEVKKSSPTVDEVISSLKEKVAAGQKIALFVGRTLGEKIPSEKDLEWASLDYADPLPEQEVCERLHLKLDFNDEGLRQKIAGLFDKVVVDVAVLRFLGRDPWRHLSELLQKTEGVQLICEGLTGSVSYESEEGYEDSKSLPPTGWVCLKVSDLTLSQAQKSQLIRQEAERVLQQTEKYLGNFFKKVQRRRELFPYDQHHFKDPIDYFVATDLR